MKRMLALVLLLLLTTVGSRAQSEYQYTANLHAFEGRWEYRNGSETFILELKVGYHSLANLSYGDFLIGDYAHAEGSRYHRYTDNIPTYIDDSNFIVPYCPGFLGDNGCARPDCVTPNRVRFYFWDRDCGTTRLIGILELLSPTTARFTLRKQEGVPSGEITVPNNITLTKVSSSTQPVSMADKLIIQ